MGTLTESEAYGALTPNRLDSLLIAVTRRLPNNWFGLQLALGLRHLVLKRLGSDNGLDVERWGLRLRLHPLRNGCEKSLLFTPQMHEAVERAELAAEIDRAKRAPRDFVFVDIGANVGLFSFFVASHAGASAKILAIEPAPESLLRLRFNAALNPDIHIQVIPLALGESAGRIALEVCDNLGGTRTRPGSRHDSPGTFYVECDSLLGVLRKEQVTYIDALKIDVEGAEDTILIPFFNEAPKTLWPRLVIIEDARGSWLSFFEERGYTFAARTKLNVMMRRTER